MIHDFMKAIPGITVRGIDISQYAIENAKEEVKEFIQLGNAKNLSSFKDKEFNLVISINTIHNLKLEECKQAIKEIERVGKNTFITIDAWQTEKEKEELNYTGDYYWFIP